ncbi:hypothetical protein PF004_g2969 [Phytophthora fragariae]|uniref:Uncharacterized protein n=2 Tax=Phytophthora fragariae TaxID=53985 RepID=A0A6G0PN24_9STRA|nr:hypothetical protein PF004_g2969 [Phytophthora fragariae]
MGAAPIPPRCMHAARMPTSLTPGYGASETSPAQLAAAAGAAVPPPPPAASMGTTGTSAVARPEAAVAPPPTEAIYQQVSSADYGQRRSKRQPHRRRKLRVSVANETRGDVVSWSR